MDEREIRELLLQIKEGNKDIDEALLALKEAPFEDMGFAKPDFHRGLRQGKPEVIYGQGKTPEQILMIAENLLGHSQEKVLITRMSQEAADYYNANKTEATATLFYHELSRVGIAYGSDEIAASEGKSHVDTNGTPTDGVTSKEGAANLTGNKNSGVGKILIATGGTSDIPVAEEAALTAEFYGNNVVRLYDVGVAGIHRILSKQAMREIMTSRVIIAIAGMEGALASVVGGLADCPVIAVPTSVGYGASFGGLSALLSMLNSCASGVSVVNIDNGFGAGYLASMINRMSES
ncbi:MAG: nickel pincer cofactor biosynthesis protein LarB [Butyrivibrio sp.]|nr:nickel pincer cofactor biosynthesis protein LarB [Butyrivibrio sp.]